MKELVRIFSWDALLETCKKEGWRLPTRSEAENFDLKGITESFWIDDLPEYEQDRESHASVFDPKKRDVKIVANKLFMMKAVVIKIPCVFHYQGLTRTSCGHTFNFPDVKDFEFCPYCGRGIEHK